MSHMHFSHIKKTRCQGIGGGLNLVINKNSEYHTLDNSTLRKLKLYIKVKTNEHMKQRVSTSSLFF